MKKIFTSLFIAITCFTMAYSQQNVTFSVDMSEYSGTVGQMYVSGTLNSWSGDGNPMTDMGNGIWEATIPLMDGFYEYKFTMDNWAIQETLGEGTPCTLTTDGFTNRTLNVAGADVSVGTVCWESCNSCGFVAADGDITFMVDMSEYTDPFTTVYFSGTPNNWSGDANPLTDMGNGMWEGTVNIPGGDHLFKFSLDNWAGQEFLAIGAPCTINNNGNADRNISVDGDATYGPYCFSSCYECGFVQDSVDITFQVNMEFETVDPAGVFIAGGGNFGNPGDFPMTNTSGNIWELTVKRPKGFASYYTITNGACPDYSCKENLTGLPCGDPGNFNDRFLMSVQSDTTLMHCFSQCTEDLSCVAPNPPVNVIFQVDMSQTTVLGPIYVTGAGLDNWCGTCLEMSDDDGDMIYRDTVELSSGTYEFKFNNGDWDGTENLDPADDAACTLTTGDFTNRIVTIGTEDVTLTPYCFEACEACVVNVQNPEYAPDWFSLQPTVTNSSTWISFNDNEQRLVSIYDTSGRLVYQADVAGNTQQHQINVEDFARGLYFVAVQSGNKLGTQKLMVK